MDQIIALQLQREKLLIEADQLKLEAEKIKVRIAEIRIQERVERHQAHQAYLEAEE